MAVKSIVNKFGGPKSITVCQKTVPMFGYFAKIELEQIEKIK